MAAQLESAAADIHAHRILILDFGAQYTQLIARRVREIGVYCEILPWDCGEEAIRQFGARGIILSGGPESVTDAAPPRRSATAGPISPPSSPRAAHARGADSHSVHTSHQDTKAPRRKICAPKARE